MHNFAEKKEQSSVREAVCRIELFSSHKEQAAFVRIIFLRKSGFLMSCNAARPELSGPMLKKNVPFKLNSFKVCKRQGTPFFMPQ